jgi:hypothetical protein
MAQPSSVDDPGPTSRAAAPAAAAAPVAGVVCAGYACVDVVMEQCDELPSREGHASVERFSLAAGGAVSNTGVALARLGVRVEAMTTVGDDDFGALLLETWKRQGIGVARFVQRTASAPTSCAALPVYKRDAKRAVYACRGTNATLDAAGLLPGWRGSADTGLGLGGGGGVGWGTNPCEAATAECSSLQELEQFQFFAFGYPHLMPALCGAPLRALLEAVARHTAVALDVNEAVDDSSLPLGPLCNDQLPFESVAILHCEKPPLSHAFTAAD